MATMCVMHVMHVIGADTQTNKQTDSENIKQSWDQQSVQKALTWLVKTISRLPILDPFLNCTQLCGIASVG